MTKTKKAWVVSANMGYGHDRAAYALQHLAAGDGVITANDYPGMPASDKKLWNEGRSFYETISRWSSLPIVGKALFQFYDRFQEIRPFYPRRDLSRPNIQVRQLYWAIRKKNLGRHLIEKLRKRNLPLVTTFFQPAFAAEVFGYPGDIYCVATDADISRTWVSLDPKSSPIKYFAPNGRVVERLKLYGVPAENIYITGFPLPKEIIGGPHDQFLKKDLARRLNSLDPQHIFRNKYDPTLHQKLGSYWHHRGNHQIMTLTFAVGGSGAQAAIGLEILKSLRASLIIGTVRLNLVAGTHRNVYAQFKRAVHQLRLSNTIGKTLNLVHCHDRPTYFKEFTKLLRTTDVLWTKPSELSFYTALGIPIIISPSIGSQEDFNATWLRTLGSGAPQNNPSHTAEWLFDWWQSGGLARMAWSGFIEAPTHGAYRIESIITGQRFDLAQLPLIV